MFLERKVLCLLEGAEFGLALALLKRDDVPLLNEKIRNEILALAVTNDLLDISHETLKKGADPDNNDGALLCEAVLNRNLGMVKLLVDYQVDMKCHGTKALKMASIANDIHIFKFLHESGADIKSSRVSWPAESGALEIMQYMIKKGVSARADNDEAIIMAATRGKKACVEYLQSLGADIHAQGGRVLSMCASANNSATLTLAKTVGFDVHRYAIPTLRNCVLQGNALALAWLQKEGVDLALTPSSSINKMICNVGHDDASVKLLETAGVNVQFCRRILAVVG